MPTQVVDGLLADLLQNVSHKLARHANVVPRAINDDGSGYMRKNAQVGTGLQTSCYKSVHKLSTSCVRIACSQLL